MPPLTQSTLSSTSTTTTQAMARRMAAALQGGETIALIGGIGTGKTTWVHGLTAGLHVDQPASSPTFVLQQWYRGRLLVCHLDLYRIDQPDEISRLGLLDPLDSRQVTVIEWADRAGALLPPDRLSLTFHMPVDAANETTRNITAQLHGRGHDHLMAALQQS